MKKLGFGFMRLPQTGEGFGAAVDTEIVKKMADAYIERGFNYFDTGYVYHMGKSEVAIKEAVVARYPRKSVIIADKMPIWMVQSHADYQKYFDEQRGRLGVEYIDNYLFHAFTLGNYRNTVKIDICCTGFIGFGACGLRTEPKRTAERFANARCLKPNGNIGRAAGTDRSAKRRNRKW
jgi:predicted aldo/keto reductase-like oxidoreductase